MVGEDKIGLVLSGGGARGIAHLGVLQALEEFEIEIDAISGTSAGAIVGVLYAYGYKPKEILEMVKSISPYKLLSPAYSWKGALSIDVLVKFLQKYIETDDFSVLKIPVHVAVTNLIKGRSEFFSEGEMFIPVAASSCVPVLFNPVEWRGNTYVDGGILNNLPIEPLDPFYEIIIGSHTNPIVDNFTPKNARQVMERSLMMAITCNVESRIHRCTHLIEPEDLGNYKVMDLSVADKIYELGYATARSYLSEHWNP